MQNDFRNHLDYPKLRCQNITHFVKSGSISSQCTTLHTTESIVLASDSCSLAPFFPNLHSANPSKFLAYVKVFLVIHPCFFCSQLWPSFTLDGNDREVVSNFAYMGYIYFKFSLASLYCNRFPKVMLYICDFDCPSLPNSLSLTCPPPPIPFKSLYRQ